MENPATSDDLSRLRDPAWYMYKSQYATLGHRFVYGNIIIRITRLFSPQTPSDDALQAPLRSTEGLALVDPSGSFMVEATIRVADPSNSKIADQAKQELLAFQTYMDGVLDLYAPDRLALDTRVKGV